VQSRDVVRRTPPGGRRQRPGCSRHRCPGEANRTRPWRLNNLPVVNRIIRLHRRPLLPRRKWAASRRTLRPGGHAPALRTRCPKPAEPQPMREPKPFHQWARRTDQDLAGRPFVQGRRTTARTPGGRQRATPLALPCSLFLCWRVLRCSRRPGGIVAVRAAACAARAVAHERALGRGTSAEALESPFRPEVAVAPHERQPDAFGRSPRSSAHQDTGAIGPTRGTATSPRIAGPREIVFSGAGGGPDRHCPLAPPGRRTGRQPRAAPLRTGTPGGQSPGCGSGADGCRCWRAGVKKQKRPLRRSGGVASGRLRNPKEP